MLVRVNAARGLVIALACVLPAVFAASAHAQTSDCPECDQYQLVIPDPRGGGEGSDGGSGSGGPEGSQDPSSVSGGEGSSSAADATEGASGAAASGAEARAEKKERKRRRHAKNRDERDLSAAAGTDAPVDATVPQQDLDYDQRPAASAALAQLANPFTILVVAAMGASLWLVQRRDRAGGQ